ncbi:MAG: hypothetical protein Q9172_000597 [Xanthocarpia lactea]
MADQLSISLRAWPSDDKTTESLPYLITRINEQRGSFRSVTEAGLQEEIRAADAHENEDPVDDAAALEDGPDAKPEKEELSVAREEMIKRVGEAYNTTSQALDLVSLILTSHASKVAEATVSPYVKQAVPFGSLGAEIMQATSDAKPDVMSEDLVGLGWRMRSLTRSADSLLTSATRLEQEIERESTYWRQVLAVKDAGWPICRLPGDRQALAVRFGFAEAHPAFRDRGLAALKRDADGNVELDGGQRWQGEKRLRVRVIEDGRILAKCENPPAPRDGDKSLTQQLLHARNSLFDEELYHELNREARNLVSQEVRCIGGSICFPYHGDSQIEISLVDKAVDEPFEELSEASIIPAAIGMTLRLLLSHAHRQNLQRRSLSPPPITDTLTARPSYALLRPILEIIQHHSMRKAIQTDFNGLTIALSRAGLASSMEETSSSLALNRVLDGLPNDISTAQTLVDRLIRAHHSKMTLSLPKTILTLDVHTSVFPPTFGTSFQLTNTSSTPGSAVADMPHTLHFASSEKLRKHVWYIACLDIIMALRLSALGTRWTMPSRYQAELQRKNEASKQKDRLSVSVDQEGLKVTWITNGQTGSQVWTSGFRLDEVPNLAEVVKEHIL